MTSELFFMNSPPSTIIIGTGGILVLATWIYLVFQINMIRQLNFDDYHDDLPHIIRSSVCELEAVVSRARSVIPSSGRDGLAASVLTAYPSPSDCHIRTYSPETFSCNAKYSEKKQINKVCRRV